MSRYISVISTVALSLLTYPSHAASVACRATMTDMNFGEVDFVNPSLSKTTTGTLTYHCSNNSPVLQNINACFYLGSTAPSSVSTASWSTMHNSVGAALLFQLKNVMTGELLETSSSQLPVRVTRSIPGNTEISSSIPISGELFSNQRALPAGSYRSKFNTDGAMITWSESAITPPNSCLQHTVMQPLAFITSAVIQKTCGISTQNIDFGQNTMMDNRNIDVQGEISVECTRDTQYRIALRSNNMKNGKFYLYPSQDDGREGGKVEYYLYQNSARTLLWSDNGNEKIEKGTGSRQLHPVYGRVPAKQAAPHRSGNYYDTVIVTLSF